MFSSWFVLTVMRCVTPTSPCVLAVIRSVTYGNFQTPAPMLR